MSYFSKIHIHVLLSSAWELGQKSWYSDWVRAEQLKGQSLNPSNGKRFPLSMLSRLHLGTTQPPIQWIQGALSLQEKCPGCEVDHLPPNSAEVKNIWIYTFMPPCVFIS
jgi:hypothetical protein